MKDKTGAPEYNKTQPQNDLENRSIFIPLSSISGSQISDIAPFLDDTAGGTDAETTKAPTTNVMYDHAIATTGVHGAGTSTVATTADITSHANLTATHGAGTILSVAAGTVLITTHAGSTDAHIGGAGTVCSVEAATALITSHAAITTGVHGISTVVDARIDDAINTGDVTTDGVIEAMRTFLVNKGWMAPA